MSKVIVILFNSQHPISVEQLLNRLTDFHATKALNVSNIGELSEVLCIAISVSLMLLFKKITSKPCLAMVSHPQIRKSCDVCQ